MKTNKCPWRKAPKDATHWNINTEAFYKFTLSKVFVHDGSTWLDASVTTPMIVLKQFKARPRKSFLNGLTWWRKK